MLENKKAPALTGASAIIVIAPSINAILTWLPAFYNGNEVITCG